MIDVELRFVAMKIVRELLSRLVVKEEVDLMLATTQQRSKSYAGSWREINLARGDISLALTFNYADLCLPNEGWDKIAHQYLTSAIQYLESKSFNEINLSLFSGLTGVCFVTNYMSRNGKRYTKLLTELDNVLLHRLQYYALAMERSVQEGVAFSDYDLISGPTGIAAYLLLRRTNNPLMERYLGHIVDNLINLSLIPDKHLGFYIPPNKQATAEHLKMSPFGSIDCGMAHGVPGPLALLSIAVLSGYKREGLSQSIRQLSDWIINQSVKDEWGINWPTVVSFTMGGELTETRTSARSAWCYGTPGIARSLWLAGQALEDSQLKNIALIAMRSSLKRPVHLWRMDSAMICHGAAGLLQITNRFMQETQASFLTDGVSELLRIILSYYHSEFDSGFHKIVVVDDAWIGVDDPGFLEGTGGIIMCILSALTGISAEWDRALLLA